MNRKMSEIAAVAILTLDCPTEHGAAGINTDGRDLTTPNIERRDVRCVLHA
jgi:hypothetical protein